ncbi:MAG: hypothetical protein ACE5HH_05110 [Candidatus Hydrothermarchaeales archaeon]
MEFSQLPPVIQSTMVLLLFVGLFLLSSWLLDVINKVSSKSK